MYFLFSVLTRIYRKGEKSRNSIFFHHFLLSFSLYQIGNFPTNVSPMSSQRSRRNCGTQELVQELEKDFSDTIIAGITAAKIDAVVSGDIHRSRPISGHSREQHATPLQQTALLATHKNQKYRITPKANLCDNSKSSNYTGEAVALGRYNTLLYFLVNRIEIFCHSHLITF